MAVVGALAGVMGLATPGGLWVPCSSLAVPPAVPERAQTLSLAPDLSHHGPEQVSAVVARSWWLEQAGFWSCARWDVDYAWNSLDSWMSVCSRSPLCFPRREIDLCMLGVVLYVYFPALRLREQLVQTPSPSFHLSLQLAKVALLSSSGCPPFHCPQTPSLSTPEDYTCGVLFQKRKKERKS